MFQWGHAHLVTFPVLLLLVLAALPGMRTQLSAPSAILEPPGPGRPASDHQQVAWESMANPWPPADSIPEGDGLEPIAGPAVLANASVSRQPRPPELSIMESLFGGLHGKWDIIEKILFMVASAIVDLVTVIGNIMVLISFKMDRSLQTVSNYFLLSLAAADVLIGLISMPLYTLYLMLNYWPLGPIVCDIWLAFDYLNSNAAVLNMLIISFDRYFSVTRPLTYRAKRTTRHACLMIAFAWVVSLTIWTPAIILYPIYAGRTVQGTDKCEIEFVKANTYLTFVTAILAFYIPVMIMCYLYWRIWLETKKRYRDLTTLFLASGLGSVSSAKAVRRAPVQPLAPSTAALPTHSSPKGLRANIRQTPLPSVGANQRRPPSADRPSETTGFRSALSPAPPTTSKRREAPHTREDNQQVQLRSSCPLQADVDGESNTSQSKLTFRKTGAREAAIIIRTQRAQLAKSSTRSGVPCCCSCRCCSRRVASSRLAEPSGDVTQMKYMSHKSPSNSQAHYSPARKHQQHISMSPIGRQSRQCGHYQSYHHNQAKHNSQNGHHHHHDHPSHSHSHHHHHHHTCHCHNHQQQHHHAQHSRHHNHLEYQHDKTACCRRRLDQPRARSCGARVQPHNRHVASRGNREQSNERMNRLLDGSTFANQHGPRLKRADRSLSCGSISDEPKASSKLSTLNRSARIKNGCRMCKDEARGLAKSLASCVSMNINLSGQLQELNKSNQINTKTNENEPTNKLDTSGPVRSSPRPIHVYPPGTSIGHARRATPSSLENQIARDHCPVMHWDELENDHSDRDVETRIISTGEQLKFESNERPSVKVACVKSQHSNENCLCKEFAPKISCRECLRQQRIQSSCDKSRQEVADSDLLSLPILNSMRESSTISQQCICLDSNTGILDLKVETEIGANVSSLQEFDVPKLLEKHNYDAIKRARHLSKQRTESRDGLVGGKKLSQRLTFSDVLVEQAAFVSIEQLDQPIGSGPIKSPSTDHWPAKSCKSLDESPNGRRNKQHRSRKRLLKVPAMFGTNKGPASREPTSRWSRSINWVKSLLDYRPKQATADENLSTHDQVGQVQAGTNDESLLRKLYRVSGLSLLNKYVGYSSSSSCSDDHENQSGNPQGASTIERNLAGATASTSSSSRPSSYPTYHPIQPKSERKAAKTLSILLLVFIVTWLPYNVIVLIRTLSGQDDMIPERVWNFSYYLCYINSTINPLCYALCNAQFRRTYMRILRCVFSNDQNSSNRRLMQASATWSRDQRSDQPGGTQSSTQTPLNSQHNSSVHNGREQSIRSRQTTAAQSHHSPNSK